MDAGCKAQPNYRVAIAVLAVAVLLQSPAVAEEQGQGWTGWAARKINGALGNDERDRRLDRVEKRIDGLDHRLDRLEDGQKQIEKEVDRILEDKSRAGY